MSACKATVNKEGYTDGCSASVDAIFHQLLAHGLKVDNDLAGLDLVDGAALDGLDGGHIKPCR